MFVDDFAKQLSRDLRFPSPLSPSKEGSYSLRVGKELFIAFDALGEGVVFYATVGLVPEDLIVLESFYLTLLVANLFGQGTGKAFLALSRNGREVLLALPAPEILPYLQCRDLLEEFLNLAEAWAAELKDPKKLLARLG